MSISYREYLAQSQSDRNAHGDHLSASSNLSNSIRKVFQHMRDHRDSSGVSDRYLSCLMAFNGEYSPAQLSAIREFGGSMAFARVTAVKCRALVALLEDLYLGADRPWRVEPTPEPELPEDVGENIKKLVGAEVASMPPEQAPDPVAIRARVESLYDAARTAAKRKADKAAEAAGNALDDDLVEGQFYKAFKDFLDTFSKFPVGILKGPFYQNRRRMVYRDGMPEVTEKVMQHFSAPSPFDVWFSPGVSAPQDGDIIERVRLARTDLERLRGAPAYDSEAIDAVLGALPNGHVEWTSSIEQARADEEERESPVMNTSGLYDVLEFHGWIDGPSAANEPLLRQFDLDEGRSHHVTIRTLADVVIGAHPNPDPLERAIYNCASFEEVPGSVIGRGLPEVLADVQNLANAAMRALINNLGLASGPQVGINTASIAESEDGAEMYPWKRWVFTPDPAAPSAQPLIFFQPQDNSQSMMAVFERAMTYADEVSAIPRYAAGGDKVGGAGRTAAGLAMLQGNVAKVIKHVAGNIDSGVMEPLLNQLYDLRLLTQEADDPARMTGDVAIRALGVQHAAKQEADRMRAIEFLTLTANPIDIQIMGPEGRILMLSEVAEHLGFDHDQLSTMLTDRMKKMQAQGMDPTMQQGTGQPANPQRPDQADPNRPAAPIEGATQQRAMPTPPTQ